MRTKSASSTSPATLATRRSGQPRSPGSGSSSSSSLIRDQRTHDRLAAGRLQGTLRNKLGTAQRPGGGSTPHPHRQEDAMSPKKMVLVVANRTADRPELMAELCRLDLESPSTFHLLVPAVPRGLDWAADMKAGGRQALE